MKALSKRSLMKNFFNIYIKILIKDLSVPISNTGGVSLSVENL